MKKTLFATLLGMTLAAASASAAVRFGVNLNIGVHAPVVAEPVMARPPMPGPGYIWIDGCNGPNGFVPGYWALPPFSGAYWVAPSFTNGRFVAGYWGGNRIVEQRTNFDQHTNFRAQPFHDDHFRAAAPDDHFRAADHDDRFRAPARDDRSRAPEHNDQSRDFRR